MRSHRAHTQYTVFQSIEHGMRWSPEHTKCVHMSNILYYIGTSAQRNPFTHCVFFSSFSSENLCDTMIFAFVGASARNHKTWNPMGIHWIKKSQTKNTHKTLWRYGCRGNTYTYISMFSFSSFALIICTVENRLDTFIAHLTLRLCDFRKRENRNPIFSVSLSLFVFFFLIKSTKIFRVFVNFNGERVKHTRVRPSAV